MRLSHIQLLLLVVAVGVFGCSSPSDPTRPDAAPSNTTATPSQSTPESGSSAAGSGVIVMTPRQVFDAEHKSEGDKLTGTHKGKTIEVAGVIESVTDFEVILKIDPPADEFSVAWAFLLDSANRVDDGKHIARCAPGQTVKLRSIWSDETQGFWWEIIESGPNPAPIINAADLAKAFVASPEATNLKYHNHHMYLVGEVAEVLDETHVTLKGTDDVTLSCSFGLTNVNLKPKVGDRLKMLSKYDGEGESVPDFFECLPFRAELPAPGVTYVKNVGKAK
ncbi:MAG: hypothetical protein IAG10_26925 [Planctomycetaceae bacterium]|nr:hypothetical protein [Planctomycetaceae bacterium]